MWKRKCNAAGQAEVEMRKLLFTIWDRPLTKQATHKDLPRLGRHLSIWNVNDELVFEADEDVAPRACVIAVMKALAINLEDIEVANNITNELIKYINEEDVAGALELYFQDSLKGLTSLDPTKRLSKILQAIQQEMIYPVYNRLRESFYERFPFKDVRGTWYVKLKLEPQGFVTVTHIKKQQSHSEKEEELFWFSWELNLHFNKDCTAMLADYSILDYGFEHPQKDSFFQKYFGQALEPFMHEAFLFRQVWSRPLQSFSLTSSLLKFASNVTVIKDTDSHSETIWMVDSRSMDKSRVENIYKLISTLAGIVGTPSEQELIEKKFWEIVKKDGSGDVTQQLKTFFNVINLSEDSKLVNMIKALTVDIVYPAAMELRERVYEYVKFRDKKASWALQIHFLKKYTNVTISKMECSYEYEEGEYFDFAWAIKMVFKPDMSHMIMAKFYVTSVRFHVHIKMDIEKNVRQLLQPYTSPQTEFSYVHSLSVADALKAVIIAVQNQDKDMVIPIPQSPWQTLSLTQILGEAFETLKDTMHSLPSLFLPMDEEESRRRARMAVNQQQQQLQFTTLRTPIAESSANSASASGATSSTIAPTSPTDPRPTSPKEGDGVNVVISPLYNSISPKQFVHTAHGTSNDNSSTKWQRRGVLVEKVDVDENSDANLSSDTDSNTTTSSSVQAYNTNNAVSTTETQDIANKAVEQKDGNMANINSDAAASEAKRTTQNKEKSAIPLKSDFRESNRIQKSPTVAALRPITININNINNNNNNPTPIVVNSSIAAVAVESKTSPRSVSPRFKPRYNNRDSDGLLDDTLNDIINSIDSITSINSATPPSSSPAPIAAAGANLPIPTFVLPPPMDAAKERFQSNSQFSASSSTLLSSKDDNSGPRNNASPIRRLSFDSLPNPQPHPDGSSPNAAGNTQNSKFIPAAVSSTQKRSSQPGNFLQSVNPDKSNKLSAIHNMQVPASQWFPSSPKDLRKIPANTTPTNSSQSTNSATITASLTSAVTSTSSSASASNSINGSPSTNSTSSQSHKASSKPPLIWQKATPD